MDLDSGPRASIELLQRVYGIFVIDPLFQIMYISKLILSLYKHGIGVYDFSTLFE